MAATDLHYRGVCRRRRDGASIGSTTVGRAVDAGDQRCQKPSHSPMGRQCIGGLRFSPYCRAVDHQSARRHRRAAVSLPDTVLGLGRDSHVGGLRRRPARRISRQTALAPENLAPSSPCFCCHYCNRQCGPRRVDRRDHGDCFKSGFVRVGGVGSRVGSISQACNRPDLRKTLTVEIQPLVPLPLVRLHIRESSTSVASFRKPRCLRFESRRFPKDASSSSCFQ